MDFAPSGTAPRTGWLTDIEYGMMVVLVKSDTEPRGLSRAREGRLKGRGMRNEDSYVASEGMGLIGWMSCPVASNCEWWAMHIGFCREGVTPLTPKDDDSHESSSTCWSAWPPRTRVKSYGPPESSHSDGFIGRSDSVCSLINSTKSDCLGDPPVADGRRLFPDVGTEMTSGPEPLALELAF